LSFVVDSFEFPPDCYDILGRPDLAFGFARCSEIG
jgi:hypothetical protein